jgi:antitoxin component of MazEF toxin-antitoxin module
MPPESLVITCIHLYQVQKPIRIGNSKGARIPAHLIRSYHLERGFFMKPVQEGILIAPADGSKLNSLAIPKKNPVCPTNHQKNNLKGLTLIL